MTFLTCTAALFAVCIQPALAWNPQGHMLSGAIAYDTLKSDNPQQLENVLALLRTHPHFETKWAKQLERVEAENRDQLLFMLAARWADDIRGEADYNQLTWHYIDIPYIPPNQPTTVKSAEPPGPNIQTAFRQNIETLQKSKDEKERAVALTWIFHLMGDVHQPLHSTAIFTTEFLPPKGDAGGTKGYIKAEEGKGAITLHKYWDDLVIGTENVRDVRNRSIELRHTFPREQLDTTPKAVTFADFAKWIQESFQIAKNDVYQNGKVIGAPKKADAKVLPEGYPILVQPVAQKRMTLSGYRLADILANAVQ